MKRETIPYNRAEVGKMLQKHTEKMIIPLKICAKHIIVIFIVLQNLVLPQGG